MTETQNPRVKEINISKEMKTSFLDYAMSVIVSRALPDVRDGMKPVHRRILYAMHDLGMYSDKAYKKSARIVGEVIGKYHPHGDSAVYETMVRMAQDFNYRHMLVDGHGNFGSVDGDSAAAMRYTEARMSKISMELLRDINKDTIDYRDNYDGSEKEPEVLPARFPNLLVNGSTGIAVGMATNIPPHHLGEVIDGVLAVSCNSEITTAELMELIPGPDFPTAGKIYGRSGIRRAYETGKGSVVMRATTEIEERSGGRYAIIVTEIPYQVNKANLIERIADLVRDKTVEGISDLRDESDRRGMRIVIELKRDGNVDVVLNKLFKHTAMQSTFGINTLALVEGQPKVLTLKECLSHYLDHQKVIIRRRTEFDLKKASARAHILEGLRIALDHIDAIISLIRGSKTTEEAKTGLISQFNLSEKQAQAILDMRLQRLTGLEREKIEDEYQELQKLIAELKSILENEEKLVQIIRDELTEIKEKYSNPRRTEIIAAGLEAMEDEDLIPEENVVITLSNRGYIKRLPASTYRSQRRGGRGIQGMGTNDDDHVEHLVSTSTHDTLLFFTNTGRVYKTRGFEIPEFNRTAKGIPVINKLALSPGESIKAIIPVKEFKDDEFLMFVTKNGISKRCTLSSFANIRQNGLNALGFKGEEDELITAIQTDGNSSIILGTKKGQSVRFDENDIRVMGRSAAGVRGIRLKGDDEVVGADLLKEGQKVLVVTKNGFGKLTNESEYREQSRGGSGIKALNVTDKIGDLVTIQAIDGNEDLMIVTAGGVIIRMDVATVSTIGRNAQGVRLIRLDDENSFVSSVTKAEKEESDEELEQPTFFEDDLEAVRPSTEVSEGVQKLANELIEEDNK